MARQKDELNGFIKQRILLPLFFFHLAGRAFQHPDDSLIVLGFSLFSRGFKKIKWAFIISILVAGGIGLLLNHLATAFSLEFLSLTVILIIAFIIFIVLFLILKAIESTVRLAGAVVSFRPIMFVGGLIALLEAALLFMGTSISGLLG